MTEVGHWLSQPEGGSAIVHSGTWENSRGAEVQGKAGQIWGKTERTARCWQPVRAFILNGNLARSQASKANPTQAFAVSFTFQKNYTFVEQMGCTLKVSIPSCIPS